jgi:hypothetical protein
MGLYAVRNNRQNLIRSPTDKSKPEEIAFIDYRYILVVEFETQTYQNTTNYEQ